MILKKRKKSKQVTWRNREESKENREGGTVMEEGEISGWKTVTVEKVGRSPTTQSLKYGQVTIVTPSRFAALRNTYEKGEALDDEQLEEVEDMGKEEADDIFQSMVEESVEESKRGRARQMLPRQSKTNHRVVPEVSEQHKESKRGSRKNY